MQKHFITIYIIVQENITILILSDDISLKWKVLLVFSFLRYTEPIKQETSITLN
jgi:hypothetical protein